VRIAAAAVGEPHRERFIVVSRDRGHAKLFEDRVDLSGIGTEPAEIAETENPPGAAAPRVGEDGAERDVIAVEASEERDRAFEVGFADQEGRRVSDRAFLGLFR